MSRHTNAYAVRRITVLLAEIASLVEHLNADQVALFADMVSPDLSKEQLVRFSASAPHVHDHIDVWGPVNTTAVASVLSGVA